MAYLGMYVHAHWSYNHPYCARTWTMTDWRAYAGALSPLGYNMVMIWPVIETIPDPPTPSDIAHLEHVGRVIRMLQDEFGMTVLITLGPNIIGNENARSCTWWDRPYFETDMRLNPADSAQMDKLFALRQTLLKHLAHADGLAVIDSDPGGCVGSTNEEFARLLRRHLDIKREINPKTVLYYWMWVGWESYNRFWQQAQDIGNADVSGAAVPETPRITSDERDWEIVVREMMTWPVDSWRVFSCNAAHQKVLEKLGVADKAIFLPYGLVEGEPSVPMTHCDPARIHKGLQPYRDNPSFLGCMANCQTHTVQQPHTYLFSRFSGACPLSPNLEDFADGLVAGLGSLIASAWMGLQGTDIPEMKQLALRLQSESGKPRPDGRYAGLLIGTAERFLTDLSHQLSFAADLRAFVSAVECGADWRAPLHDLTDSWEAWTNRTGFIDAYCGWLESSLHPALRKLDIAPINSVLDDFGNWQNPAMRHGIVRRLLAALKADV